MESLKLKNLLKKHSLSKIALIYSSHSRIIKELTFNTVFNFANTIKQFLLHNISQHTEPSMGNTCIGLLMEKNIFIPSIIICFQDLNYSFVFLTTNTLENIVKTLNINWILSVDNKPLDLFYLKNRLKISAEENIELWHNNVVSNNVHKDIFCIVQTSGSTGDNKIVYVPCSCIEMNVITLNNHFNVSNSDIIYWGTPLTFDPTLIELLLGLIYGATLLLVPKLVSLNPLVLYKTLFKANAVTFLQVVPSIFLRWNQQQISDILLDSSLKILAFGGECFPQEILNYKRKKELKLFNLYGVTELSCWATIADLSTYSYQNEVPLGKNLNDTFIEIKNEENGIGEICIGSHTRHCFLSDSKINSPFIVETGDLGEWKNNNLFYRGRKTRLIKRFGHRVAMHKIEEIIFNHTGLISRLIYSTNKKLLVFIKIEEHYNKNEKIRLLDKLRIKLLNILPDEAFPDFLDVVTHFPLNPHGKISDKLLEIIYENNNLTKEENISDIFINTLSNYLKIQLSDNLEYKFTELGGNSLLLMQFLQSFEKDIQAELPGELVTLLLNDSIDNCLNYVKQNITLKRKSESSPVRDDKDSKILKIDQQDCILWKFNLKGCVDCAPLAFKKDNKIFIACGSFAQTFSIICENGQEYLTLALPQEIEAKPCLSNCANYIFIGCANGSMYSINLIRKNISWQYQTQGKIKSCACIAGNNVIFGSYDEYLYSLAIEDGKLNWKTKLIGSIKADLLLDNKLSFILAGTIKGICFCLNKENGSEIWSNKIDGPIFGSPCIFEDCTVWSSVLGTIYCFTSKGEVKWTLKAFGNIFSSLSCYNNAIYFACHDAYIYKINNGEISKFIQLESEIASTPFLYYFQDKIFVICVCNSGILYVIDSTVIFRMQLSAQSFSSPYVFENKIYVGCRDDNLYCINIEEILIKHK